MIVVTQTYKLAAGADRDAYLASDKALQEDVLHQDPGFIRRTVARDETSGEWCVVTFLWDEATNTDLPLGDGVDLSTLVTRAYRDIGG